MLDHTGDHDAAFEHARRANALRREIDGAAGAFFDPAAHRGHIDRLIGFFTPSLFERARGFGVDSELPIFVVGMMRSGTTLAEQILASHPQVHGAGELRDVERLSGSLSGEQLDAAATHELAAGHLRKLHERGGAALRVVDKNPLNFLRVGLIAVLFPRTDCTLPTRCDRHVPVMLLSTPRGPVPVHA